MHGDDALTAVVAEDTQTGERQTIETRALFVFIGADPNTSWLAGAIELDDHGFVSTGSAALYSDTDGNQEQTKRQPLILETSRPGVFAAGDVADRIYRQAITSAGAGCMAALDADRYLESVTTTESHR